MHLSPENSLAIWPNCTYGNKVKNVCSQTHTNTSSLQGNFVLKRASNHSTWDNYKCHRRSSFKQWTCMRSLVGVYKDGGLYSTAVAASASDSLKLEFKLTFRLKDKNLMVRVDMCSAAEITCNYLFRKIFCGHQVLLLWKDCSLHQEDFRLDAHFRFRPEFRLLSKCHHCEKKQCVQPFPKEMSAGLNKLKHVLGFRRKH